jgi:hypothetical protein
LLKEDPTNSMKETMYWIRSPKYLYTTFATEQNLDRQTGQTRRKSLSKINPVIATADKAVTE